MKNLILILSILFAFTAIADIGPSNRSVAPDNTGAVSSDKLDKYFITVKNQSGGALVSGDVVILDVANDDGYSVTSSTTAGAVPHCVLDESCADDAFCKCQTYGLKTDVNFTPDQNNAAAGGQAFLSETQAGKSDAITSVGAGDRPIGVFYDAASASGDVEVFIQLR